MKASKEIRVAIDGWEGDVLTCYLDPVGVPTIGKGFTNGSRVLTEMLGKLKPGVTKITKEQSDKIFEAMLSDEYEPAVNMPGAQQHEFDVGVSTVWNLGPKSQTWTWAKLFRAGKIKEAADYLRTHYNKAGGKKLPGLVRRRQEEGDILEFARYPRAYKAATPSAPEGVPRKEKDKKPLRPDPVTKEAQERLKKVGLDVGVIDGWFGPKTKAAILTYQRMHPHLKNDGVLGPATIAQLRRDTDRLKKIVSKTVGFITGPAGAAWFASAQVQYIAAGVAVAVVVVVIHQGWKYRDVWQRRINQAIGKTVEV